MKRMGLTMHTGNKLTNKPSKTEAIYLPSTLTCKKWISNQDNTPLITSSTSPSAPTQITPRTKPNAAKRESILREKYTSCPQAKDFEISDGNHISFTPSFKYLGSVINFLLYDKEDIDQRITKANKAMGALKHFWRSDKVDTHAKYLIYMAIPLNLLLWGCESWALP